MQFTWIAAKIEQIYKRKQANDVPYNANKDIKKSKLCQRP